jgi:putative tryptophan/tyrosine transport system substrate-binding protein
MRRREFIAGLGGAAWSVAARAQQPAMPVVGFLSGNATNTSLATAFRQGLKESGYSDGQNVSVEYRSAEGQLDRLPTLAADFVLRRVNAIAALGNGAVLSARAATTTIPIVFQTGVNPVEFGLVAALSRPGGNLTGVTSMNLELGPKRLELLHELVPTAAIFALLVNPTNSTQTEIQSRDLLAAAQTLGLRLDILRASTEGDFDTVFATLDQMGARGLVISADALFNTRAKQLAALAVRHAVPAIYPFRDDTVAGGLMSYGGSFTDQYRQVGNYIGRILKGEKPADLPVQQSTKFEFVINLQTARALGLTVPQSLLLRADEVIE